MTTTTATSAKTAILYARVSKPGQAGPRHVSLEVQEAEFRAYCHANNLTPLATFIEAASGRKDDRPQYRAMLQYVADNNVDCVVVLWLDRFGRNPKEILRRYWALEESGTTVESIKEDLKEELLLLVRAGIAGAESRRISERVSMALQKAAAKGNLVNRLCYGYRKVYDTAGNTQVEQVPSETAVIRQAYDLAVGNRGYKSIANELNTRGYRTRNGNLWTTQTVKLLLTNPAVGGHFVRKGATETVEHRDKYPAILDATEWGQLQERLAIRREKVRGMGALSHYLLSGIARCGHCGGAMTGASGGRLKYYKCANKLKASAHCAEAKAHRQEYLETAVLEYLGQYADPNVVRELLEAQELEVDTRAEGELTTVSARLAHLERAFLNDLDRVDREVMTEAEYLKRQEVRRGEQEGLQARKIELESAIAAQRDMEIQVAAVPVRVQTFLEDFQGMDVQKAKAVLQGIIKAAHVFSDGRIELEFRG